MASSFRRDAVSRIAPAIRAPLSKGDIPHVFFVMKKKIRQTEYRTSQIPQLVSNKKQPDVYPTEP